MTSVNKIKWLKPHLIFFYNLTEEDLLARCIYGEAESEPFDGKFAVGCVIRNRVLTPGWWGNTYHRVILSPYQFSCFNKDSNRLKAMMKPRGENWQDCQLAAKDILSGEKDIVSGATHYFAEYIDMPEWAKRMVKTAKIGRHIFYTELGVS